MITSDDRLFSLLHICAGDGINPSRIPGYTYVLQRAGLDTGYAFKLTVRGISCSPLDSKLSDCISNGFIEKVEGLYRCTPAGYLYYDNVMVTALEDSVLDYAKSTLDKLTDSELDFLCAVDRVILDVICQGGSQALIDEREKIITILQSYSSEYTVDNFNTAIRFFKEVAIL